MKDLNKVMSEIVYVGQLGLTLIMPVLLCLAGSWFLDTHFVFGTGLRSQYLLEVLSEGGHEGTQA